MRKQKLQPGFTLIELLVVISIIALLASVVLLALNQGRSKARDAKRIADFNMIAKALELYADKNNGLYPDAFFGSSNPQNNYNGMREQLESQGILKAAQSGPSGLREWLLPTARAGVTFSPPTTDFLYEYNTSADRKAYRLRTRLENQHDALKTGLTGPFLNPPASSGQTACDTSLYYYCIGSLGTYVPL
jgi:prepilin-type N-terminal cleavage/methylation domain-containing protein